jgi:hypothetical protein
VDAAAARADQLNENVRGPGTVTSARPGLDELVPSIAAHGLLQPLVVRKAKRGKYTVIAGGRRLAALQRLARDKQIDPDTDVPCTVGQAGADDRELKRRRSSAISRTPSRNWRTMPTGNSSRRSSAAPNSPPRSQGRSCAPKSPAWPKSSGRRRPPPKRGPRSPQRRRSTPLPPRKQ